MQRALARPDSSWSEMARPRTRHLGSGQSGNDRATPACRPASRLLQATASRARQPPHALGRRPSRRQSRLLLRNSACEGGRQYENRARGEPAPFLSVIVFAAVDAQDNRRRVIATCVV
eukprot:1392134-Pyramimonas_sp.AAC.1